MKENRNASILITLASTLAGLLLAGLPARAATINFNSPVPCAVDTDALPIGQVAYAYDWGAAATVNGVPFAAATSASSVGGGNVTLANFGQVQAATYAGTAAPYTNLSAAYQNVLKGAVLTNTTTPGTTGTVTLNNLAVGHLYAVQAWVNDSRGGTNGGRLLWIYDGAGSTTN